MKNHTKLIAIIGILFCSISTIQASSNDNGPYSPATIIPYAFGIITAFVINTTATICSQTLLNYIKQAQIDISKQNNVISITHADLKQNQYISQTSNNLPEDVLKKLQNEQNSFHDTAKTHIHFNGATKEYGELLAQKIAFQTHSNYYTIETDPLNPQLNLKDFQTKITRIAEKTTRYNPGIIYINVSQEKLTNHVFNQELAQEHNLYTGTLAQAINDLSAKYPHIRIITSSSNNNNKKINVPKTNSYYDPTRILTNFTIFNEKKPKTQKQNDFLLVQSPEQNSEELSLYTAYAFNKHNKTSPSWFWKSQSPNVVYKPSNEKYINNYFYRITKKTPQEIIDKAIQQARIKKLTDNASNLPLSLMQKIYTIFVPKKVLTVDTIDILGEIADQKYPNKCLPTFTQTNHVHELFKNVPEIPTNIMRQEERSELKTNDEKKTTTNFFSSKKTYDIDRANWTTQEFINDIKNSSEYSGESLIIEHDKNGILEFQKRKNEETQANKILEQKLKIKRQEKISYSFTNNNNNK